MSIKSDKDLITISTLKRLKEKGEKFACLTAYEATIAEKISKSGIEVILVGDSLGMVIQGHDSTLCLLYTSPSPRDVEESRMPSSA